jgi:glycerol kinase
MIFNHAGESVGIHQLEHAQIYPQPGWVEHDPIEIWERTQEVIGGAMNDAGITAVQLAAIGITNQRETAVVWDKHTGQPYYNAIVWQDTRNDKIVAELAQKGGQDRFRAQTGLPLATYFSGLKLKWLLKNVAGLREAAVSGSAIFGNIDTWLIWNLTGGIQGGVHVTDAPTIRHDAARLVEVHLLDYTGDLYGAQLQLDLVARIRDEQRFDGPEALVQQIQADIEASRRLLRA